MDPSQQLDIQLKVWKDLAVSKQILMRTAATALKLDPDCSQEELKEALEAALKKIAKGDQDVIEAREQARQSIIAMEMKLNTTQQALNAAQKSVAELTAANENLSRQGAADRTGTAKELTALKNAVAEKDKQLKAINTALADTPDNVLKKMKALKKEKQDAVDAQKQVESSFTAVRREKQQQDTQLTELRERTTKLVSQHRELHKQFTTVHEQLKPLVADATSLPGFVELDTKLVEEIEQSIDPKAAKSKK